MSFADKATAFKHSVSGSSVNKSVCKASSHELAGPKKKHVDTLISLTNNPHSSMPMMADMLSERFHNSSWIVVMKALITAHNLMTLGNEKFIQCMATRVAPFPLEDYVDRSSSTATQMSGYVRKYGRYLTSVCTGYRTLVLDIYRMPRGERSPFRTMEATKLLKSTTTLQQQLDYLLEVDVNAGELTNGVINTAFLMLYKDLTKLYSCYNDVMINLLEKFFEMKKSQCREVIDAYRKFLTRQELVVKFLTLAENVGVDKQSHLNLRQVPEDLLPALESHLKEMDAIRKAAAHQQPSPQIRAASEKLAQLSAKSPTPDKPPTPTPGSNGLSSSESIPSANEELLAAQRKRFEELKRRASEKNVAVDSADSSLLSTATPAAATATAAAAPSKPAASLDDEFDKIIEQRHTPTLATKGATTNASSSGANDLFGLNNWSSPPSLATTSTATTSNPWGSSTTNNPFQSSYQEVNLFGAGTIQPTTPAQPGGDLLGDILLPQSISPLGATTTASQPVSKPLTTDVNSSLAAAAQNLSLDFGASKQGTTVRTTHQWGEVKPTTLTGGPSYMRPGGQLQPKTLPAAAPSFPVNPSVPMYQQPNYGAGGGMGMGMQPQMMMGQPQMMSGGWPQQQPASMMYPGSQNPFGPPMPTTNTQSLF